MTSQIILFHRGLLQYNDNNGGNSDGNGNKLIFEDVCPSHNMTAPSLISLISLPFHWESDKGYNDAESVGLTRRGSDPKAPSSNQKKTIPMGMGQSLTPKKTQIGWSIFSLHMSFSGYPICDPNLWGPAPAKRSLPPRLPGKYGRNSPWDIGI